VVADVDADLDRDDVDERGVEATTRAPEEVERLDEFDSQMAPGGAGTCTSVAH
jgi:hypothetical protein